MKEQPSEVHESLIKGGLINSLQSLGRNESAFIMEKEGMMIEDAGCNI